jgi:hypothetical protein
MRDSGCKLPRIHLSRGSGHKESESKRIFTLRILLVWKRALVLGDRLRCTIRSAAPVRIRVGRSSSRGEEPDDERHGVGGLPSLALLQ